MNWGTYLRLKNIVLVLRGVILNWGIMVEALLLKLFSMNGCSLSLRISCEKVNYGMIIVVDFLLLVLLGLFWSHSYGIVVVLSLFSGDWGRGNKYCRLLRFSSNLGTEASIRSFELTLRVLRGRQHILMSFIYWYVAGSNWFLLILLDILCAAFGI